MLKQHGQHFVTPLNQLLQAWISTLSKRVGINSQNKTNQHAAVLLRPKVQIYPYPKSTYKIDQRSRHNLFTDWLQVRLGLH